MNDPMNDSPDPIRPSSRVGVGWRHWTALAVAGLLVVLYYGWIVAPAIPQLVGPAPSEAYYNLLADGFRAGQLSLKKEPAPELAKLANPYDPGQNAAYRLHDATYFRGKYYLYFGVTPVLVLFLPYTVLTGHYLSQAQAVWIFSSAGFLASMMLCGILVRRYFPTVRGGVLGAIALGLGLATATPIAIRRPDVWEVPISCGYCFVMLMLIAIFRALESKSRWGRVRWLAVASLACGLAVGARPSYVFSAAVLLLPVLHGLDWFRRRAAADWRAGLVWLAAAGLPLGFIGLGLMLYNYLRFGSITEFGAHYQLGGLSQTDMSIFSFKSFWFALRLYFYEPVHWSSYFPFVRPGQTPASPMATFGVENTFGMLTGTPFVWLALAAPLAWWRREEETRRMLLWLVGALALFFLLSALTMCLFSAGACVRYQLDFSPVLVLLAGVGTLGIERAAAGTRWRLPARAIWGFLLLWSAVFTFGSSCQYWDLLRGEAPGQYQVMARVGNYPAHLVEKLLGVQYGPVELTLHFPPFTGQRSEPLLVTGSGVNVDYLYVHYVSEKSVVIGLEHTSHGGPVTDSIPVDYGRDHTLVIEMGSLYPPVDHPFFPDRASPATLARSGALHVSLDGRVVMHRTLPFYDGSPQTRWIGANPYAQQFGRVFTGRIISTRTLPAPDLFTRPAGPVVLEANFGRLAEGTGGPLIVTGVTGRGDFVYVRRLPDGRLIFGFDHWGGGATESEPQEVDPYRVHRLEIQMGSLYPTGAMPAPGDPARRRLRVILDGRDVLAGDHDFHPATAEEVYIGYNPIGGSSATVQFTGNLIAVQAGN